MGGAHGNSLLANVTDCCGTNSASSTQRADVPASCRVPARGNGQVANVRGSDCFDQCSFGSARGCCPEPCCLLHHQGLSDDEEEDLPFNAGSVRGPRGRVPARLLQRFGDSPTRNRSTSAPPCPFFEANLLQSPHYSRNSGEDERYHDIEWLNFVVKELWPYTDKAINNYLEKELLPQIKAALPSALKSVRIVNFSLGDNPPKLGPVHSYSKKTRHAYPGIELDVGFSWESGEKTELSLDIAGIMSVGINELKVDGEISIVFKPLLNTLPIVGGLQIFMINKPRLQKKLTGAAAIAHFPVVCDVLDQVIMQHICDAFVLPNRIFVHWIYGREHETSIAAMQYPMLEGLLRIGVLEARGLPAKDWNYFTAKKTSSDPYAIITVGNIEHKTDVKPSTICPVWGDSGWADFPIYSHKQQVDIRVFDRDLVTQDDFLGRVAPVTVRQLLGKGDGWVELIEQEKAVRGNDVVEGVRVGSLGEVNIVVRSYGFTADALKLQQPALNREAHGEASTAALLTVELRYLRGLPKRSATGVIARICVEGKEHASIPSRYVEAEQDLTYDTQAAPLDPAIQRLVDTLITVHKVPSHEVSELCNIEEGQLGKILKQRPSFTTHWNQAIHIPLKNPWTTEIDIKLKVPAEEEEEGGWFHQCTIGAGDSGDAVTIALVDPFLVERLIGSTDMTWSGILQLERKRRSPSKDSNGENGHAGGIGPKGCEARAHPPFDLDVVFKLYALVEGASSKKNVAERQGKQSDTAGTEENFDPRVKRSSAREPAFRGRKERFLACFRCHKQGRSHKKSQLRQTEGMQ